MPKINMANIQSALGKVKDAAAPLQNKGHSENVPVDFIRLADRNIYNEGDSSETIKELADNIEACGLLHPITVNKIAHDNYQIISGERRFRAVTEYLHWKSVPCMVFDGLSAEAAQLKLCMANLAVREYTASQKYRFYLEVKALLEKMKSSGEYKGGMQKGIATILNVTERQVRKYAQIEKLPENVQQDIIEGKISLNKAMEQISEKSESENEVFNRLFENLTQEQRNLILSGKIDLSAILSKAEPVPIFEDTATSPEPKKAEPVPISDDTAPTPKQPRLHDGSILIYKNGQFIPNKIQILEEHEEYTVFKVFAVKL